MRRVHYEVHYGKADGLGGNLMWRGPTLAEARAYIKQVQNPFDYIVRVEWVPSKRVRK